MAIPITDAAQSYEDTSYIGSKDHFLPALLDIRPYNPRRLL
jgi:hypothetical protein